MAILKDKTMSKTSILLNNEGNWEVWYRGVKFCESKDLEYCSKKMGFLLGEDEMIDESLKPKAKKTATPSK